ncbi:MAG: hypothetical protein ACLPKT_03210, partial [Methylocella sp.]
RGELYDKGGDLAMAGMSRRTPILANRPPLEIDKPRLRSLWGTRIWPKARRSVPRSRAAAGSPGSACGGSSPP